MVYSSVCCLWDYVTSDQLVKREDALDKLIRREKPGTRQQQSTIDGVVIKMLLRPPYDSL